MEIKIATLAPDGSTWMRIMEQLDAEIREKTAGEAGLRFYPGGVQGDEASSCRRSAPGSSKAEDSPASDWARSPPDSG